MHTVIYMYLRTNPPLTAAGFWADIENWPSREIKRLSDFSLYFFQKWVSIGRLDSLLAKTLTGRDIL